MASDEIRMTLLHHSTNDLVEELLMWRGLAAEHLDRIAELEEKQRWIPVSERLPEEKQTVLALDKTGTAYHWEYSRSLSNIFVSDYTHWMPLPELPEEVK